MKPGVPRRPRRGIGKPRPWGTEWEKNIEIKKEAQKNYLSLGGARLEGRRREPAWFTSHVFMQLKPTGDIMGMHQPARITCA